MRLRFSFSFQRLPNILPLKGTRSGHNRRIINRQNSHNDFPHAHILYSAPDFRINANASGGEIEFIFTINMMKVRRWHHLLSGRSSLLHQPTLLSQVSIDGNSFIEILELYALFVHRKPSVHRFSRHSTAVAPVCVCARVR